jgi:hypothetical protein
MQAIRGLLSHNHRLGISETSNGVAGKAKCHGESAPTVAPGYPHVSNDANGYHRLLWGIGIIGAI